MVSRPFLDVQFRNMFANVFRLREAVYIAVRYLRVSEAESTVHFSVESLETGSTLMLVPRRF